jgi:hypothetical protein
MRSVVFGSLLVILADAVLLRILFFWSPGRME